MRNQIKMKPFLLLLMLVSTAFKASCQNKGKQPGNKVLFIAPFIELSYNDSLEIGKRYSNTYYSTEAYSMKYKNAKGSSIYIENFTMPIEYNMHSLDSNIKANIENWERHAENDTIKLLEKPVYINENGFVGSVTYNYSKISRQYSIVFSGSKIYDDGHTTLVYKQSGDNEVDKSEEISKIRSLLRDIKYISQKNIKKTEADLIRQTKIEILKTGKAGNNLFRYQGEMINYEVKTKRKSEFKYAVEIPINFGRTNGTQIIEPNEQNDLIITFKKNDDDKTKKCNLILTTKSNRKIKIPFVVNLE